MLHEHQMQTSNHKIYLKLENFWAEAVLEEFYKQHKLKAAGFWTDHRAEAGTSLP